MESLESNNSPSGLSEYLNEELEQEAVKVSEYLSAHFNLSDLLKSSLSIYIASQLINLPILLTDVAIHFKLNVFVIAEAYIRVKTSFTIDYPNSQLPLIDPVFYIPRYIDSFPFTDLKFKLILSAIQYANTFDRGYIISRQKPLLIFVVSIFLAFKTVGITNITLLNIKTNIEMIESKLQMKIFQHHNSINRKGSQTTSTTYNKQVSLSINELEQILEQQIQIYPHLADDSKNLAELDEDIDVKTAFLTAQEVEFKRELLEESMPEPNKRVKMQSTRKIVKDTITRKSRRLNHDKMPQWDKETDI
ncbi:hypothetical protein BC833DRAFT_111166 [Globomyces pollinis-pini]|nr:hypothetical protein BC833DRAFT_111166 [Globomyces pollinis-pini]